MAAITRGQLIALTREAMDADAGDRWSPSFLLSILDSVFGDEWSNILNAAPYFNFAQRSVTTDANGRIPLASLSSGTGDAEENFYRVLAVYDQMALYTESNYRDVPMATVGSYTPQYPKQYYIVGDYVQILPPDISVPITLTVNYKPTALADLASDSSVVTFPEGNAMLLACEAAGRALETKAGAEDINGAQSLFRSAQRYRADFLDDLARRTINPRRMGYPDNKNDWGG
jgi:hypothetical protein